RLQPFAPFDDFEISIFPWIRSRHFDRFLWLFKNNTEDDPGRPDDPCVQKIGERVLGNTIVRSGGKGSGAYGGALYIRRCMLLSQLTRRRGEPSHSFGWAAGASNLRADRHYPLADTASSAV